MDENWLKLLNSRNIEEDEDDDSTQWDITVVLDQKAYGKLSKEEQSKFDDGDINIWFGDDEEMTSLALGLHEKLVKQNGVGYATTDEYYKRIDETMRKRFPENFELDDNTESTYKSSIVTLHYFRSSTVVSPSLTNTKAGALTRRQVCYSIYL